MKRVAGFVLASVLLPSVVFAHSEEAVKPMLALSLGQGLAVLAIVAAAITLKMSSIRRMLFLALPIFLMAGVWMIPFGIISSNLGYREVAWLALGVVPPSVTALVVFVAGIRPQMNREEKA